MNPTGVVTSRNQPTRVPRELSSIKLHLPKGLGFGLPWWHEAEEEESWEGQGLQRGGVESCKLEERIHQHSN